MQRKTLGRAAAWGMAALLGLGASAPEVEAVKPEWNTGMLLLKSESGMGRSYTGTKAVIGGVETWYRWYSWEIENFCYGNSGYTFYAWLPGYGMTQVTAEKLASTIHTDNNLTLGTVPQTVVDAIEEALQDDHDANAPIVSSSYQWDPYGDWKWRSVFMEGRYAENGSSTDIMSNCWGNANYLTRSWEWADGYSTYKDKGINFFEFSTWASSFPHIYLDGGEYYKEWPYPYNDYSIDRDLNYGPSGFGFEGYGNGTDPRYIVNSFDIVRMATWPSHPTVAQNWEMEPTLSGINVGENLHSAVYLTTDDSDVGWMYQKGNFGATLTAPYGIHHIGDVLFEWDYGDGAYRSYFSHAGYNKVNLPGSYETDWADVE